MGSDNVFFVLALLVGVWVGFIIGGNSAEMMIKQCEQSLPRTQHCVLSAIPVKEESK